MSTAGIELCKAAGHCVQPPKMLILSHSNDGASWHSRREGQRHLPAYTSQIHLDISGALKYVPTQNIQLATLVQVFSKEPSPLWPNLMSKFNMSSYTYQCNYEKLAEVLATTGENFGIIFLTVLPQVGSLAGMCISASYIIE